MRFVRLLYKHFKQYLLVLSDTNQFYVFVFQKKHWAEKNLILLVISYMLYKRLSEQQDLFFLISGGGPPDPRFLVGPQTPLSGGRCSAIGEIAMTPLPQSYIGYIIRKGP